MPATVGYGHAKFPGDFQFQCRFPHDAKIGEGRLHTVTWSEAYAARVFLEHLIGKKEPRWTGMNCFVTSTGVEVSCSSPDNREDENCIERALNHDFTKAELAFQLPDQERRQIAMLTRPWPDVEKIAPKGQAKVERGLAARRPDGSFVTVAQLCEEMGLEAREGRAALRKAKIEKPTWGWQFPVDSDELTAAKKAIQKAKR